MPNALPSPIIGILGGGQLGRMLVMAAARLGLRCVIYDPDAQAPAGQICAHHIVAAWDDQRALKQFAEQADVITYEFENIPLDTAHQMASHKPLRPGVEALRISQDRLVEKRYLEELGLRTARYWPIDSARDLRVALAELNASAILKSRRFGYDGKGQISLKPGDDTERAWAESHGVPAILEERLAFTAELSVIAARAPDGQVAAFDPGQNTHEGGILRHSIVPAKLPRSLLQEAVLSAGKLLSTLDYVGVLGLEFFVVSGQLVVNEFAPRVHNSGHWTQNGCAIDQFEQHIRAIAGWPLGDGTRHSDVEMHNLIGDDMLNIAHYTAQSGCALHLYGKAETRPGRKMGHVNLTRPKG